jgi:hypothetical protein
MKSNNNQQQSNDTRGNSAIDKVLTAHNEIVQSWFAHWSDQERSRIDLTFERSSANSLARRHTA